jgi:glutathione S-transferase
LSALVQALAERSKLRVKNFYADFDTRLAEVPFVAGNTFSAADITALVAVSCDQSHGFFGARRARRAGALVRERFEPI